MRLAWYCVLMASPLPGKDALLHQVKEALWNNAAIMFNQAAEKCYIFARKDYISFLLPRRINLEDSAAHKYL